MVLSNLRTALRTMLAVLVAAFAFAGVPAQATSTDCRVGTTIPPAHLTPSTDCVGLTSDNLSNDDLTAFGDVFSRIAKTEAGSGTEFDGFNTNLSFVSVSGSSTLMTWSLDLTEVMAAFSNPKLVIGVCAGGDCGAWLIDKLAATTSGSALGGQVDFADFGNNAAAFSNGTAWVASGVAPPPPPPIPLPTPALLLLSGLGIMGLMRRRQRA